jgi:pimeloyl-ACP methyl ester carboxylesterase
MPDHHIAPLTPGAPFIVDIRPDEGGLPLSVLGWPGDGEPDKQPVLLLHGLSSNACTWAQVAAHLAAAGHAVYAVDQRGHGHSAKPETGYDFVTVTDDLRYLCDALGLTAPIIAGQSWGGNVVLTFAARYPERTAGIVLVDGGYIDLQMQPQSSWEEVSVRLRPPNLIGTPRSYLKSMMQSSHPDWSDEGVEATLANFETLPDGTVRPWLSLDRHLAILHALWLQRPGEIFVQVTAPVLIAVADDPGNPGWMAVKQQQVTAAAAALQHPTVYWFPATAHDIHVHRPSELAALMLDWMQGLAQP